MIVQSFPKNKNEIKRVIWRKRSGSKESTDGRRIER
jgi:hypothetical protein